MKLKTLFIFPIAAFFVIALNAFSANASNTQLLSSIKTCLPIAEAGTPYRYSIASYTDIKPTRWLLVRVADVPYIPPSYSVIEVKNNTCKNYHRYPVSDLSRSSIPKPVINKFTAVIKSDSVIAGKVYYEFIKRQYPGRSEQELRRMGVYGMDNL